MTNAAKSSKEGARSAGDVQSKRNRVASRDRTFADPVKVILDGRTRDIVGWLYRWESGHEAPMWINGRCENVIYE